MDLNLNAVINLRFGDRSRKNMVGILSVQPCIHMPVRVLTHKF
jgi:hypothetical protein